MSSDFSVTNGAWTLTASLAPWDDRAFGFKCAGIKAQPGDQQGDADELVAEAMKWLHGHRVKFCGAEVPASGVGMARALESVGFRFADIYQSVSLSGARLRRCLEAQASNAFLPKGAPQIHVEWSNGSATDTWLDECLEQSFTANRFWMDPNLSRDAVSRRYRLWGHDLLQSTHHARGFVAGQPTVFSFAKVEGKEATLVLGGAHPKGAPGYLRVFTALMIADMCEKYAITRVRSRISLSNQPIINLYNDLNFVFSQSSSAWHWMSEEA